ncbi:hypothetical protein JOB18_041026 [Solea senegalensis]|uniref:Uncharacterized protein n=1 Tax=Solea senegalensis TaxID=28829 RepID=A0AAV6RGI8_SOLSE|nr:hypothetical protein JOB18_041026 [Solea senegalensis]
MTPLRRPRDTLGGMKSGVPSLSPFPSRSDMTSLRRSGSRFRSSHAPPEILIDARRRQCAPPLRDLEAARGCDWRTVACSGCSADL